MSKYVCKGAKLKCSMGNSQSDLNILPEKPFFYEGKEMANIQDNKPMVNIQPFGQCQSLLNPTVAMATAANFGVLQPMPCVPNITAPWMQGHSSFSIKGQPALLDDSKLMCAYAGTIEIADAGQTSVQTGATGIEKEEIVRKGWLELIKIKVDTDFDVCSDEVKDFNDYPNFYVLEEGGEYYHWLKKPADKDKEKLEFLNGIIPITLHSEQVFKFKATFKVCFGNIDDAIVEVNKKEKEHSEKYNFELVESESDSTKNLKKDDEITLTFKAENTPYKNTIQYFERFILNFDITDDSETHSKRVRFRLYLTWKKPDFEAFIEKDEVKIEFTKTRKSNILESFLYFGCAFSKGLGNNSTEQEENEEQILDAIFKQFESLSVKRVRENNPTLIDNGMGYWRGLSAAIRPLGTKYEHKLKFLLTKGEARCPQWAQLFIHIAWCHDINVFQASLQTETAIMAKQYRDFSNSDKENFYCNTVFLVQGSEGWTINNNHRIAPIEKAGTKNKAQGNKKPLHFFWDHVFAVYDKKGEKKFYDPSYGIKSDVLKKDYEELLESYTVKALDAVIYARISALGSFFEDKQHTNKNLNLFLYYNFFPEPLIDKYEYKYLTKAISNPMKRGLYIQIVNWKTMRYVYNGTSKPIIKKL